MVYSLEKAFEKLFAQTLICFFHKNSIYVICLFCFCFWHTPKLRKIKRGKHFFDCIFNCLTCAGRSGRADRGWGRWVCVARGGSVHVLRVTAGLPLYARRRTSRSPTRQLLNLELELKYGKDIACKRNAIEFETRNKNNGRTYLPVLWRGLSCSWASLSGTAWCRGWSDPSASQDTDPHHDPWKNDIELRTLPIRLPLIFFPGIKQVYPVTKMLTKVRWSCLYTICVAHYSNIRVLTLELSPRLFLVPVLTRSGLVISFTYETTVLMHMKDSTFCVCLLNSM